MRHGKAVDEMMRRGRAGFVAGSDRTRGEMARLLGVMFTGGRETSNLSWGTCERARTGCRVVVQPGKGAQTEPYWLGTDDDAP